LKNGGATTDVIAKMARRVLLRPLTEVESAIVVRIESDLEKQFASNVESAKAFLSVGESKPDPTLPASKLAALSMIASDLLNLDEALNK